MNDYSYIVEIEVDDYPLPFCPVTSQEAYLLLLKKLFDAVPDGKTLHLEKGGLLIVEVEE